MIKYYRYGYGTLFYTAYHVTIDRNTCIHCIYNKMYTEQTIVPIFILPWECRLELVDNASMEHTDISRIRAKALT